MISIYLNIVNYCNLACKYCYAEGGIYQNEKSIQKQIMSEKIALDAINNYLEYKKVNSVRVIFFGGEPLLAFSQIQQIVEACEKQKEIKFVFGIVTNGVGITKEVAHFFKIHNFLITVSFEGTYKTQLVRTYLGGKSSFENVMIGMKALEESGVGYNVRMTYTKRNIYLRERLEALQNLKNVKSIRAMMVSSVNSGIDIDEKDLEQYETELYEVARTTPELLGKYQPIHSLLEEANVESNAKCCLMGINGIAVDVNGDIYSCYRLVGKQQYVLGNIKDKTSHIEYDWYNALASFCENIRCKECNKKKYCKNICYAENLYINGTLNEPWIVRCKELDIHIKAAKIISGERRDETGHK